jgi:hypothetical protein
MLNDAPLNNIASFTRRQQNPCYGLSIKLHTKWKIKSVFHIVKKRAYKRNTIAGSSALLSLITLCCNNQKKREVILEMVEVYDKINKHYAIYSSYPSFATYHYRSWY